MNQTIKSPKHNYSKHQEAKPIYRKAQFVASYPNTALLQSGTGYEIAFAGRSNAGKSSTINSICGQKSLCRTSKQPGRTQQLVLFELDQQRRIMDLPGYGFAKVTKNQKAQWQHLVEAYLSQRDCLIGLMIVVDIRRGVLEQDEQLMQFCHHIGLQTHIVLNKCDKLNNSDKVKANKEAAIITDTYGASLSMFSALKKIGIEALYKTSDAWLNINQAEDE